MIKIFRAKYVYLLNCVVLACDDEILNATENSLDDEKVRIEKNQLFYSHCYMLVIISYHLR